MVGKQQQITWHPKTIMNRLETWFLCLPTLSPDSGILIYKAIFT